MLKEDNNFEIMTDNFNRTLEQLLLLKCVNYIPKYISGGQDFQNVA